jgi:hypothetical protein
MLDVRPFQAGDEALLQPQHQQALEMVSIGDWRVMVRDAASHGPAWTGWQGDQVVGCAGVTLRWHGRAHAWCVLAPGIPKSAWIGIHRAVLTRLPQLRTELELIRLEAEAMRGFLAGDRWLRMLGFEFEGVMRCYGPGGEDFGRYALVTP